MENYTSKQLTDYSLKLIKFNKWRLTDDNEMPIIYLKLYTAGWCGPCKRVKPYIYEIMRDKNMVVEKILSKESNMRPKLVPFFELVDDKGEVISSIQNSDKTILEQFFKDNDVYKYIERNFSLDDDF